MSDNKNIKDELNDENLVDNKIEEVENNKEETNEDKKVSKKIGKNLIITTLVGCLTLGIGFMAGKEVGRSLPATSKSYSSSKVIATVGDSKITEKDLSQKMEVLFFMRGKEQMTKEEIESYESKMIDYLTTTEVLYLEGKKDGIEVTKENVDAEYANIMMSVQQAFGITEDQILNEVKIPKEDIEAALEKELIATNYMTKMSEVSEEEVKSYYDENKEEFLKVRASHILIQNMDESGNPVSDEQKQKNKDKAMNILEQAKAGVDFAQLAKEYSEDGSAENGGDLDFFMKGQMVEPFEKASYALKVGEMTDELVETDFGYHIIKKTDEKYEEFDTIKEDLQYTLSYEKQNAELDKLIKKYNVEVK